MYSKQRMMNVSARLCLLACLMTVDSTVGSKPGNNVGFTFLLPAGSTECFFETTMRDDTMEVGYQVIAGSGLDVGFTLISPTGHRLVSNFRSSDGIHTVDPTEDGDYRLCFDNSFSKLSQKMVFFEVAVSHQSNIGGAQLDWLDMAAAESMVGYKLEDIWTQIDSVYQQLERTRQIQAALRAFEARDRYLLEDNLWRVSFWSCVTVLVMFSVGVTQIYTVRRLFDDRKRIHS
ncbi:uncharacterized protein V6R79_021709 [Siganus canaliculatus]